MQPCEDLIYDKIAIPRPKPGTSRRRLLKLLAESTSTTNATIMNGRAGTGKTTLAANFARRAGRAVAWYKVDAADNNLRLFCKYLSASTRLHRPSINSGSLLELADQVAGDQAQLLADAFVFQLIDLKAKPLLIVIEDLHLVADADWVAPFFRRVLSLLPPNVHALITCRSLLPERLWRLRSKQMLRLIEETELAFTLAETIELCGGYGLSEDHARMVWVETNGRASAIADSAATPGRIGRAMADRFRSMSEKRSALPDFQA